MLKKTAILLFSDYQPEQASKVFAPGKGHQLNARIAEDMFQHTLQVAQESGLPLIWIGSHQQTGSTFGQRFAQAIEQLFAQGYEHLITIGDDCPELDAKDLQAAAYHLEKGTPTLGPARDGGVYLIGLSRKHFQKDSFANLAWCGRDTSQSLNHYFLSQGALVNYLSLKRDVDRAWDLLTIYKELPRGHFFRKWITLGRILLEFLSLRYLSCSPYSIPLSLPITRPPPKLSGRLPIA